MAKCPNTGVDDSRVLLLEVPRGADRATLPRRCSSQDSAPHGRGRRARSRAAHQRARRLAVQTALATMGLSRRRGSWIESARAGLLSIERRDEVALVTLQRPEKRNALSIDLRVELGEAFARLGADDEVGCVVLTGAGTAFCSGMDVTQFGGDAEHKRSARRDEHARLRRGRQLPRGPVVAAVNGPALAGGFALALLCDLRIAAERGDVRLPRAAARDPAELRRRARGAAGDGRPGPLPHGPDRSTPAEALRLGHRARGLRRRRRSSAASSSPSRSPRCRARRSWRPSAASCSSAATSGAFCSRTSAAVFARALLGDEPDAAA